MSEHANGVRGLKGWVTIPLSTACGKSESIPGVGGGDFLINPLTGYVILDTGQIQLPCDLCQILPNTTKTSNHMYKWRLQKMYFTILLARLCVLSHAWLPSRDLKMGLHGKLVLGPQEDCAFSSQLVLPDRGSCEIWGVSLRGQRQPAEWNVPAVAKPDGATRAY